ncbi:hypothetical protein FHX81_4686 [Saccharothrix saharensis]|uniref:Uncharacterized protein n=1 Tax=Saccharothrix saharensis TaxID=571190 RepID=A0A543JHL1_9PSEU|nr:hypothetical protein [Saccharothrix saharensis]TQM82285.1 hypothetical protein FHX81_4686 [Saccharothrix saharensis]
MTEPVPGQTPEPAAADGATTTPPPAREPEPDPAERAVPEPAAAEPTDAEPGTAEADAAQPDTEADGAPAAGSPAAGGPGSAAANPQELFGSLSLSAIEADIDRLMSDKMSQLDGMLAGLEDLVQRLEGEITDLETPPDEPHTPQG